MRITIPDIAKIAHVSTATVSRAINSDPKGMSPATREKILRIIDELGYKPNLIARGMATSKTKTIGLIIPDITNPFFPQLVRAVEDYANLKGYTVFLCNSDKNIEKEKKYISTFIEKRVEGVILASNTAKAYEEFIKYNVPFVLLDRDIDGKQYETGIFLDNRKGAYTATKYLIENGNKSIAFISGPISVTTSQDRLAGYKAALKEAKIIYNEKLFKWGDYSIQSGYELLEELMKDKTNFSAVFAGNDLIAIGVLKALKGRNIKIPDEVEIIGFDDIEMSEIVEPALTTIKQPIYEMAYEASKVLIDSIDGRKPEEKHIIMDPTLIVRETTRPRIGHCRE